MSSILGQCSDCCTCPSVAVESKTRSLSKSKLGYSTFVTSSPPKIYSTKTNSVSIGGSKNESGNNQYGVTCNTYSSSTVVSKTGGGNAVYSKDQNTGVETLTSGTIACTFDCTESGSQTAPPSSFSRYSTGTWSGSLGATGSCLDVIFQGYSYTTTETQATSAFSPRANYTITGAVEVPCGASVLTVTHSGAITDQDTLSSEYTTSALITNTIAALPAYGAFGTGSPSASRNLATNELSLAVAESVYRFRFKVPKVGSGTTYIIKWVERFSPEGGGAVTDTVKTFTWSGTIPGGYDPTNSTTWPLSDEYTMDIPATDGTVAIACITVTCSGTAPADPCNP